MPLTQVGSQSVCIATSKMANITAEIEYSTAT